MAQQMPADVHEGFDVPHLPAGNGAAAASLGAWPATASGPMATAIGPGNQSCPGAVRADGAPRPRAWHTGAGRHRAEASWRRHYARLTAGLFAGHAQDDPGQPGAVRPRAGTPTRSRVNRAGDSRLAPLLCRRLDRLAGHDGIGGRRVDDVPVRPLRPAQAVG